MVAKETTSTPQGTSANKSGSRPAARPRTAGSGSGTRGGGRLGRQIKTPSLATFFQESYAELRKVTWPTRQETMNLTGAVIAMTVSIAAFLGVIDTTLDYLVKPLIGAK